MRIYSDDRQFAILSDGGLQRGLSSWRFTSIILGVFVLSFAFDFKGSVGGSPIQYAMAIVNELAFVCLSVRFKFVLPKRGLAAFIFWAWWLFIVVGSVGTSIAYVSFGKYVRVLYPFVLFLEGFLVAWWVTKNGHFDLNKNFIRYMILAGVVSLIFNYWWGFYFTGMGIKGVRFHILSPLIPFLITTSLFDLFFSKKNISTSAFVLLLTGAVIFSSLTRGYLLPIFGVVIIVFSVWIWSVLSGYRRIPKPFLRAAAWTVVTVGVLGVLAATILHSLASYWETRLFGADNSVTFWTRIAFARSEWDKLISHNYAIVFGSGFGQSYSMSNYYSNFIVVPGGVSQEAFMHAVWAPGEIMWMSLLFYGGIVCGSVVCVGLVVLIYRSLDLLRQLFIAANWRVLQARPIWLAILSFLGFMVIGLTDNPFGYRISSMFIGIVAAIIVTTPMQQILSKTR